jgi:hypothetical protein
MLIRYLGAVATAAAEYARTEEQAPAGATGRPVPSAASPPQPSSPPKAKIPLVRDVMDAPAASLHDDLPYRDIARFLAREQVGAVPVVDGPTYGDAPLRRQPSGAAPGWVQGNCFRGRDCEDGRADDRLDVGGRCWSWPVC